MASLQSQVTMIHSGNKICVSKTQKSKTAGQYNQILTAYQQGFNKENPKELHRVKLCVTY